LQHESSDTFDLQRELRVAQENNSKLAEKLGKIQNSYKLKSTDLDAATTKIQDLEASVRSLRAQEDELKANHMEEVIAYKDANYDLEKLLKKLSTRVKELESSKDDLLEKAKALAEENTRLSESLKQLNVEKSTQKRSFQKQNPGKLLTL
jgi:septation ring formation regulator EzrA